MRELAEGAVRGGEGGKAGGRAEDCARADGRPRLPRSRSERRRGVSEVCERCLRWMACRGHARVATRHGCASCVAGAGLRRRRGWGRERGWSGCVARLHRRRRLLAEALLHPTLLHPPLAERVSRVRPRRDRLLREEEVRGHAYTDSEQVQGRLPSTESSRGRTARLSPCGRRGGRCLRRGPPSGEARPAELGVSRVRAVCGTALSYQHTLSISPLSLSSLGALTWKKESRKSIERQ